MTTKLPPFQTPPAESQMRDAGVGGLTHDSHPTPMFRSIVSKASASATRPLVSRVTTRPVLSRGYHEKVISHYESPRNVCLPHLIKVLEFYTNYRGQVGSMNKNDHDVGTGLVGAPA